MSSLNILNVAANRLVAVPVNNDNRKLQYMNLEGNNISSWPKDWVVQKDVAVAELPFNTTARVSGNDGDDGPDGLYETYVAQWRSNEEEEVLLVLTSGNSAVSSKSTGGAARLLEVSRGISTDGLPRMLVSNQPECAAGCPSTPWDGFKSPFKVKLVKMDDRRGDMECDAACDVSACQFDKGDCELF